MEDVMLKNIKMIFIASIIFFINSLNASAIELNIKLGDDIIHNQHKLNVSYDLYFSQESFVSQLIRGQDQKIFSLWLAAFNEENKNMTPIEMNNAPSYISLGYNKDGVANFPDTCQHIILTNIKSISLTLTESGCVITAKKQN
jgi:hypothetical protein